MESACKSCNQDQHSHTSQLLSHRTVAHGIACYEVQRGILFMALMASRFLARCLHHCLLSNLDKWPSYHKSSSGRNVVEYGPQSGQVRLPYCSPHCRRPPSFPITASRAHIVSINIPTRCYRSTVRTVTYLDQLSSPPSLHYHCGIDTSSRARPRNPS